MSVDPIEPFALAARAASQIRERTGVDSHDVVVVLGSGWREAADSMGPGVDIEMASLDGFPVPTAMGHGGTVRSVPVGAHNVLVMLGRVHLYEGHGPAPVAHAVRVAHACGARVAILTNGAGFLRREWDVGQAVLISDHINVTGQSPLTGANPPSPYAGRFVDLTDAYSPRLRAIARTIDPTLPDGVYFGLTGPHFETPAEIRMAAVLGADLVGMSTVLETIAARHLGMEVLGVSLACNLAAGISATPLSAEEVIAAGNAAAPRIGALLATIVRAL
jgi:purine-nucleoside phosphorylase